MLLRRKGDTQNNITYAETIAPETFIHASAIPETSDRSGIHYFHEENAVENLAPNGYTEQYHQKQEHTKKRKHIMGNTNPP